MCVALKPEFLESADELEPIIFLVSSWQKLEFECWPALLNEVKAQFETNAGKVNIVLNFWPFRYSGNATTVNASIKIQWKLAFVQCGNMNIFKQDRGYV